MKTLIILVLLVLLLAVTFFTRPSEASFKALIHNQADAKSDNPLAGVVKGVEADLFLSNTAYHDHYLWTTVEKDGKTIYVGAFAHWFDVGSVKEGSPDNTSVKVKLPA